MPRISRARPQLPREQGAFANQALEAVTSFLSCPLLLDTPWDPKVKGHFRKLQKHLTEGEILQASQERHPTSGKESQAFIFLCILSFFFFLSQVK